MNNFARGMITGAIIGAAMGMMTRNNKTFGMSKKTMRSGRRFIKAAGSVLGNLID